MELNANFDERAVVHAGKLEWKPSPMKGVDRRMLDRLGDEVARATTIVRYAPGSHFSPHVHTGGEEYLVLDGVFQDDHGDFPVGSYVRNPPNSSHTPGSEPGCTIFVKLWQFDMEDRNQIHVDTANTEWVADPDRDGVEVMELYKDDREKVFLEQWAPGSEVSIEAPEGIEILVITGGFEESGEAFEVQSWLRLPRGSSTKAIAGENGAKVWIKRDHLKETPKPPAV
ncbi:MAG: cupin domain-containing protein [Pseudomonadota bacterium]